MKKSLKRTAAIMVAFCMAVIPMTACSGKSSSQDHKAEPTSAPDKEADKGSQAADGESQTAGTGSLIPSKPTEVNFWHSLSGSNEETLKEIVDAYNTTVGAERGITVNPLYQGSYEDFSTKMAAAMQSGDTDGLPDLVQLSSKGIFDVKDSSYIYPIQNMIDIDPEGIDISNLNSASAAYCTYNGKLLGAPLSTSSVIMYYNKDHFDEVGLDPENPPKTIAELAEAVGALTKKSGGKIERYGLGTKLRFFILGTWIPSMGPEYMMFNNDNGRSGTPTEISMTKDGSLSKVLTEWSKVLETGGVEFTDMKPNESFLSGYYSIMFASTSSLANSILEAEQKGINLGVAEIVRVDEKGSLATGIGGSAIYMMDRGSDDSRLASWDFVKYLATPEVSAQWFTGTGYYPMNMQAMDTEMVKERIKEDPQFGIINVILKNSAGFTDYTEPWIPSFSSTDTLVQDEIIEFSNGNQDIATTIKNIEEGATRNLEDYLSAQ